MIKNSVVAEKHNCGDQRVLMATAEHQEHGTRKDTYIGNPDSNLSRIFFGRKNYEMVPRKKGAGAARVRRKKGALHTLYTFGTLNT